MEQLVQAHGPDTEATLALLGGLGNKTDGVELAYDALDLVVARYRLSEAHLVLRPEASSSQIFGHGRRHVTPEQATKLIGRPSGLYASPDTVPMAVRDSLTGCCELALAAQVSRRLASFDPSTGLSSRRIIESGLRRAASRSARFRWPFTVVLLAAAGAGSPAGRWQELSAAVRTTLRECDEAGVAGPGRAMALLANAGPEAVEPFVGRLRAALEAGGSKDARLLFGSATAPTDSVDPDQLWRLCEERAADDLPTSGASNGAPGGRQRSRASEVEIELRCLPGVVSVGTIGLTGPDARVRSLTVVALQSSEELRRAAIRVAAAHLGDVPVTVLDGVGRPDPSSPQSSLEPTGDVSALSSLGGEREARQPATGRSTSDDSAREEVAGPPLRPGTEERDEDAPFAAPRVMLLLSAFDRSTGASEISLSWRGLKAVGRATGSPLAGAAQATLSALEALGADVPYYLTSVDRATAQPGSPVVVTLAHRKRADDSAGERRLGVATGDDQVDAASRATLSALNRLLAKSPSAP
jgi:hypothetical protein